MSDSVKHIITELANELKTFSRNDVLVHFSSEDSFPIEESKTSLHLPVNPDLKKIFKKSLEIFKESGSSAFCLSQGILEWEWAEKTCETPILLYPANIKLDKVKQEFNINWNPEEAFLNPFITYQFNKEFDYVWPEIDSLNPNWTELQSTLKDRGFTFSISSKNHFGNFHHHRFVVLRELERLEKKKKVSPLLQSLFSGEMSEANTPVFKNEPRNIFPADNNQHQVFELIKQQNLVVHGPPGTGKSQVLANVLGKNIRHHFKTLVVSEKRVALEVLKKKMKSVGLEKFIFLQGANANTQSLLNQLKETWQFLESYSRATQTHLPVSKLKLDSVQFKLNVLSKPELIGGVSYFTFLSLKKDKKLKKVNYVGGASSVSELIKKEGFLLDIFDKKLHKICRFIPKKIIDKDDVFQFDEKISSMENQYNSLRERFSFQTKKELEQTIKRAAFCQVLKNEKHKDYFNVLKPNSTDGKKFTRWSKKYFVLKKELDNAIEKNDHWAKKLTQSETKTLQEEIKLTGFFQKRKVNKHLKSILKSPFIEVEQALKDNLEMHSKNADFREIQKKLTEIGVKEETEIFWVKDLLSKMTTENWTMWSESDQQINNQFAEANAELNTFYQNIRTYLQLSSDDLFSAFFEVFKPHFSTLLAYRKKLSKLSSNLYKHIGKCDSFVQLECEILKSNWVKFIEQLPSFRDFDMQDLEEDLEDIILHEKREALGFVEEIIQHQKNKFDQLQTLLQAPARQLSTEEKARKVILRKGRSILIKEFAKSRSHPSIRELLKSEAKEWIMTLMPVWMLNPSQVGDYFPMEKDLFDMALFDEATQIPLRNGLGALQRSKRAMVLGDEHQMSPTSLFKSGDSEPMDLLHQAKFNWPKVMLKHHYRSEYPELISFSNKHFYENELIAYPSAKQKESAVQIHMVEKGVYNNNQNIEEAKKLIETLSPLLKTDKSIGIVAFSEKQLKCILENLSENDRVLLEDKIDKNQAFCRALENVQGEECDQLLVSLGYGKNEEGKLKLNFGPLNRKSGRRRLNVLFSRAKLKIDFFSSITAKELALSDNDSLNLLRFFLQQTKTTNTRSIAFPHGLTIKELSEDENGQTVSFTNLIEHLNDANELLTFYRVMTARSWKILF